MVQRMEFICAYCDAIAIIVMISMEKYEFYIMICFHLYWNYKRATNFRIGSIWWILFLDIHLLLLCTKAQSSLLFLRHLDGSAMALGRWSCLRNVILYTINTVGLPLTPWVTFYFLKIPNKKYQIWSRELPIINKNPYRWNIRRYPPTVLKDWII